MHQLRLVCCYRESKIKFLFLQSLERRNFYLKSHSSWSIYTDEDLVFIIQQGNPTPFTELFNRFNGLFYAVSYSYMNEHHIPYLYLDDLISISTDSLMLAIKKYTHGSTKFMSFWWSIVITKFKNYYEKNKSLQLACGEENFHEKQRFKMQDIEPVNEPEYDPLSEELILLINKNINKFTKEEAMFFQFTFLGYKSLEIGQIVEWNRSKLFRIRRSALDKLNMIIKSN